MIEKIVASGTVRLVGGVSFCLVPGTGTSKISKATDTELKGVG
jgi:hypothetical protein